MTSKAKLFVSDVNDRYNYTESRLDENYNIIVKKNNRELTISSSLITPYYQAYKNSTFPRTLMIDRAVSFLITTVKSWEQKM